MQSVGFLSEEIVFNWLCMNWTHLELNQFDLIMIVFQLIGLNWTVCLKCFKMTFDVIWRFINKAGLH